MKRITNKNVLTVLSILSVLALFAGICGLSLFGLYRVGVIEIPGEEVEESIQTENGGMTLPVHTESEEVFFPPSDEGALEQLIAKLPFSDSYYVKIILTSDRVFDPVLPEAGTYEIWRYGDLFQINHYDLENKVVQSITCDGVRVQIKNYRNAATEYKTFSADCNFETFSPIPNFHDMTNRIYEATSYREADGVCTVIYEYENGAMQEKIDIVMETGAIRSFARRYEGRLQLQFSLAASDFNFAFQEYMFALD